MNLSVASVTVAFNAERVLARHLETLLLQRRPLQEIVVVDNASTDGTAQILASRFPQVTVLRLPENTGSAGGYAAGLAYAALEKRHDWTWLFDDDSQPDPHAAEKLLGAIASLGEAQEKIGMLASRAVHEETGTEYLPLLWRDRFVKPSRELAQQPVWFADLAINSGTLVRREVVEEIGLPRADFFCHFDDFEYCLRMRQRGYKIAVIRGSRLGHSIGNPRRVNIPGMPKLWPDHPAWRKYYVARNMTFVFWKLYPNAKSKWFVVKHLARHACGTVLFGSQKLASVGKMLLGFWDGRSGKLGIRFRP